MNIISIQVKCHTDESRTFEELGISSENEYEFRETDIFVDNICYISCSPDREEYHVSFGDEYIIIKKESYQKLMEYIQSLK